MEPKDVRALLVPENSWSRAWEPQAGVAEPYVQPVQGTPSHQVGSVLCGRCVKNPSSSYN